MGYIYLYQYTEVFQCDTSTFIYYTNSLTNNLLDWFFFIFKNQPSPLLFDDCAGSSFSFPLFCVLRHHRKLYKIVNENTDEIIDKKHIEIAIVVYSDQQMVALHTVCWPKLCLESVFTSLYRWHTGLITAFSPYPSHPLPHPSP